MDDIDSMLHDFVGRVPGAHRALVAATDGSRLGFSTMDSSGRAIGQLSGVIAAVLAVTDGCGRGLTRTIKVGLADDNGDDAGLLVVTPVGTTACLAVQAKKGADTGLLVAEMTRFAYGLQRTWPLPTRLTGTIELPAEAQLESDTLPRCQSQRPSHVRSKGARGHFPVGCSR